MAKLRRQMNSVWWMECEVRHVRTKNKQTDKQGLTEDKLSAYTELWGVQHEVMNGL